MSSVLPTTATISKPLATKITNKVKKAPISPATQPNKTTKNKPSQIHHPKKKKTLHFTSKNKHSQKNKKNID